MRPAVRPGPGPAVEPSKWLAATMSTLPADKQGQLAGLFRGLQAKTVDFRTFVREAEGLMGPKFQDLLALMRNQGQRPIGQQQHHPGQMTQQQQQHLMGGMMRPNHPLGVHAGQTGTMDVGGGSGQQQQQLGDVGRNAALMRQMLAHQQQQHQQQQHRQQQQQQHGQSNEGFGGAAVASDMIPLALSASLSSSMPLAAGMGAGGAVANPFEVVIARWRQIILNPMIPTEQLAKLSMQLSAYGEQLSNPSGPMGAMGDEAKAQQFAQLTKLQGLIAHRRRCRQRSQTRG
ncbi:hypothetical protein BX661DRAFT_178196 [Kickxella alabastrina]|uniref:uncharacterized protein n=1 Tax=Kickxella alabastrina TaxID=61397 RepID=UPI00221EC6E9|nr:uncharacterized protein BX661DRAFT_178196 [Kickxella alabastrina]KAI7833340.1 hypothetical protein BX661DRAFT_178196 [Kickxella alabastrina]